MVEAGRRGDDRWDEVDDVRDILLRCSSSDDRDVSASLAMFSKGHGSWMLERSCWK